MWARVVELMLACWLAISPFVFGIPGGATLPWATALATAALVALLSLGSFHRPLHRLHLLNLPVALWLVGVGFLAAEPPPPPALQGFVVVGLLLAMFAIIPSGCNEPPRPWQAFRERNARPASSPRRQ